MERAVSRNERRKKIKKLEEDSRQWKINEGVVGRQRWLIAFYATGILHPHFYRETQDFLRKPTENATSIRRRWHIVWLKAGNKKTKKKEETFTEMIIAVDDTGKGTNRIKLFACRGNFPMATAKLYWPANDD